MKKKNFLNQNEKQCWSLRKLSVGLSSVMLGLALMGNANVASADTTTSVDQAKTGNSEKNSAANTEQDSNVTSSVSADTQSVATNDTKAVEETTNQTSEQTTTNSVTVAQNADTSKQEDATSTSSTATQTGTNVKADDNQSNSDTVSQNKTTTTLKVVATTSAANTSASSQSLSASLAATQQTQKTGKWSKYPKGWSYKDANGNWTYNKLMRVDGSWYYFDSQGYAKTGWYDDDQGSKYYFDKNSSKAVTGWQTIDNDKYYFDKNTGIAVTGIVDIDKNEYLFDFTTAKELTGWHDTTAYDSGGYVGKRYYDESTGKKLTGWQTIKGNKYYLDPEWWGKAATGWRSIDGKDYYFSSTGIWNNLDNVANGHWYKDTDGYWLYKKTDGEFAGTNIVDGEDYFQLSMDNKNYIFDDSGHLVQSQKDGDGSWLEITDPDSGKKYKSYLKADGKCAEDGLQTINGKKYIFKGGELCINGKYENEDSSNENEDSSNIYFADKDGVLATNQWNTDSDGKKVYSKSDGTLAQSEVLTINNVKYFFDEDCHLIENAKDIQPSWQKFALGWSFKDNDGKWLSNQLKKIDNSWYYFDNQGYASTGWKKVDGKWYYFDPATSKAVKGWKKLDGQWYYFSNDDAAALTGVQAVDGKFYNFDSKDAWVHTGWDESHSSYYEPTTAAAVEGWKKIDGKWYFFNTDAEAEKGFYDDNGRTRYFTASGIWDNLDGVKNNSWYKDSDGAWLYKDSNGNFVIDAVQTINGKDYLFDTDGRLLANSYNYLKSVYEGGDEGSRLVHYSYITDKNGVVEKSKWIQVTENGKQHWVYTELDGTYQGKRIEIIDGKQYVFDDSGFLITDNSYRYENYRESYLVDKNGKLKKNEWVKATDDNKEVWLYAKADSTFAKDEWLEISGKLYYFDSNCQMLTNSKITKDYEQYYLGASGTIATSQWIKDTNGKWIYAKADGKLAKDETITIGKTTYTFDNTCHLVENVATVEPALKRTDKGWIYTDNHGNLVTDKFERINDKLYYFNDQGIAATGLKQYDGVWYYFDSNNAYALTGLQKVGGKYYYFDLGSGEAIEGLKDLNGKLYYFDQENKNAATYWKKVNNTWYYFDPSNAYALTGWQNLGNQWYYFDPADAHMLVGWNNIGGKQQYFNQSGVWQSKATYSAVTGTWEKDSNRNWIFTKSNGEVAKDEVLTINGKRYAFDHHGHMVVNKYYGNYYADQNGEIGTNRWNQDFHGNKLYSLSDGTLAKNGIVIIGGKEYLFNESGQLLANNSQVVLDHGDVVDYAYDYVTDQNGVVVKNKWIKVTWYGNQYWTYARADGTFTKGIQFIGGKEYLFDYLGHLVINSSADSNNKTYYADQNGVVAKNKWIKATRDGKQYWMYAKTDGTLAKSEVVNIGGKNYFFDYDERLSVGNDGQDYVTDRNGIVKTNQWVIYDGRISYVKADGTLATDEKLTIDGNVYYFSVYSLLENCIIFTNKQYIYANKYGIAKVVKVTTYNDSDNKLQYVIYDDNGKQRIFDSNGDVVSNKIISMNEHYYYIDGDGVMVTTPKKWIKYLSDDDGQVWLYVKTDGTLANLEFIDGKKYYFGDNCYMQKNAVFCYYSENDEGGYYYADADGNVITTPNKFISYTDYEGNQVKKWLYVKSDGTLANSELVDIGNNKESYFDSDCYMRVNEVVLVSDSEDEADKVYYYVDANGVAITTPKQWIHYTYTDVYGNQVKKWLYVKSDGTLAHSELVSDGNQTYAFGKDCYMSVNVVVRDNSNDSGNYYYINNNGVAVKTPNQWIHYTHYEEQYGEIKDWLWIKSDGTLAHKELVPIGEKDYYFDDNCYMSTNQVVYVYADDDENGGYYYVDESGAVVSTPNKLIQITIRDDDFDETYWVYVETSNGKLAHNKFVNIEGKEHYFGYDCSMGINEIVSTDDQKYYYADTNGVIFSTPNNWITYESTDGILHSLYVKSDGTLARNETVTIENEEYTFDGNCFLINN